MPIPLVHFRLVCSSLMELHAHPYLNKISVSLLLVSFKCQLIGLFVIHPTGFGIFSTSKELHKIELLLLICISVIVAFLNSLIENYTIKFFSSFSSIVILTKCLFVMFELIKTAILIAEDEPIMEIGLKHLETDNL